MLYIDKNGKIQKTTIRSEADLISIVQEIRLWKGENLLDTECGVDYQGVLDGAKMIQKELSDLLDRHSEQIASYELEKVEIEKNTLKCGVFVVTRNLEILTEKIEI